VHEVRWDIREIPQRGQLRTMGVLNNNLLDLSVNGSPTLSLPATKRITTARLSAQK
jgi:hypothetical protein